MKRCLGDPAGVALEAEVPIPMRFHVLHRFCTLVESIRPSGRHRAVAENLYTAPPTTRIGYDSKLVLMHRGTRTLQG